MKPRIEHVAEMDEAIRSPLPMSDEAVIKRESESELRRLMTQYWPDYNRAYAEWRAEGLRRFGPLPPSTPVESLAPLLTRREVLLAVVGVGVLLAAIFGGR